MSTHLMDDPRAMAKRIDATAWGLLFLMTGLLLFMPENRVPEGLWLILAGAILVGVSAIRYIMKMHVSAFVAGLGILGILAGISSAAGVRFPLFALFLVLIGATITLRSWFARGED